MIFKQQFYLSYNENFTLLSFFIGKGYKVKEN